MGGPSTVHEQCKREPNRHTEAVLSLTHRSNASKRVRAIAQKQSPCITMYGRNSRWHHLRKFGYLGGIPVIFVSLQVIANR
jgi:hypothetical protein